MDTTVIFIIVFFAVAIPLMLIISKKLFKNITKYKICQTGVVIDKKPYEKYTLAYNVLIEYTYNGETYREWASSPEVPSRINSYFEIGSEIRIYLNPDNPRDIYCGKHINGMGLG